ncbi:MAG TPA: MBL fold metallo-hydrolase [Ktedonobacterales bacterium]|nr:MBL fold metallo-hydrolase [Ktedonobacterales bacterium]
MAEQAQLARQLEEDVWVLDTLYQGKPGVIASYLLTGPDGLALVDVGSAASLETLLAGIQASGHDPAEVTRLLLTHIHLDHAGATGPLLRHMPRAQVYVHSIGAPHLIDPSKLIASATRIYGDQMETLWGHMEPVPADRVHALEDGDTVQGGARTFEVVYTPGHAVHHVAYADRRRAEIFPGDVAGVRLEGIDYVRPPTPPPDLDLELWSASIERLRDLRPRALYLPHYGPIYNVPDHLAQLSERLYAWGDLMRDGIRAGRDDHALAAELAAVADPEVAQVLGSNDPVVIADATLRYELATNYLMSAQGYMRYYTKLHPEALA